MKSVIEEGSSISKAIETGWVKAGKPKEFTVKIFQEAKKNFFGFTKVVAKVAIFFQEESKEKEKPQYRPRPNNPRPSNPNNPRPNNPRSLNTNVNPNARPQNPSNPNAKPSNPNQNPNNPRPNNPNNPNNPNRNTDRPVQKFVKKDDNLKPK